MATKRPAGLLFDYGGTLHHAGVPMGVVSNSSFGSAVIRRELDKHGLADHLSAVVVSAEYAVRKPNPLLFETAAARIGTQPRDVWFVGDRLDMDIAGARAAGMVAIWFAPAGPEPAEGADMAVRSWASLLAQFQLTAV